LAVPGSEAGQQRPNHAAAAFAEKKRQIDIFSAPESASFFYLGVARRVKQLFD